MTEAPEPDPRNARNLRVNDAEREYVIGLLQKAIGRGLISLEEFTTRTDTALAAKTRADLNSVLVDLPGMVHRDTIAAQHRTLELRSTMSALRRTGAWVVPRELVVRNQLGGTELDFTDAVIEHPVVDVELDVTGGATTLLLPEGATVNTDRLEIAAGSLRDKVGSTSRVGRPHFVIRGVVRAGRVTLRQAAYVRIGSLVVRFPWRVSIERD